MLQELPQFNERVALKEFKQMLELPSSNPAHKALGPNHRKFKVSYNVKVRVTDINLYF